LIGKGHTSLFFLEFVAKSEQNFIKREKKKKQFHQTFAEKLQNSTQKMKKSEIHFLFAKKC